VAVSERIGRHLRSNVVGYLALFVALTGTAVAIPGHHNVKSKNLATGAVKSKAIAKDAVKASKIRDAAVTNPAVAAGAISSTKLAAGAVVSNTLGDASVTSAKLADDAVIRQKIAQGSINGGKLANGSVDSSKVNDGSLLADDFAAGQLSDGFVLTANGNFSIARAGRVFVTATLAPTCGTAPCTYSVAIDGTPLTDATFTVNSTPPGRQVTLVGLTAALTAGQHTITLATIGTGASAAQVRLGGILLQ
jgi:hypothetical protein